MNYEWVIVDLDGTLCDCSHRLEYAQSKQWDEFHKRCIDDPVIKPIADMIVSLRRGNCLILAVTGRNEKYRELTYQWLRNAGLYVSVDCLLMRPDDDFSPDHEMKINQLERLFGSKERVLENVAIAIDDRDSVVEGFRNYGITTLQCAQGGY